MLFADSFPAVFCPFGDLTLSRPGGGGGGADSARGDFGC